MKKEIIIKEKKIQMKKMKKMKIVEYYINIRMMMIKFIIIYFIAKNINKTDLRCKD